MKRQEVRDANNLKEPSEELDRDASEVLAAAIEVHRILGPGFLESVYGRALGVELRLRNLAWGPGVLALKGTALVLRANRRPGRRSVGQRPRRAGEGAVARRRAGGD